MSAHRRERALAENRRGREGEGFVHLTTAVGPNGTAASYEIERGDALA